MTSPIPLHAAPAATFDEPFEMLVACHERAHRMLDLLRRLDAHLVAKGADPQARQAATDVMRYFDLAGPAHHEDEERHLFPLLRAAGDARLAERVQGLQQDHRDMTAQWSAVRADLLAVAEGRPQNVPDAARRSAWVTFAALYARHIAAEEAQIVPAARLLLDAAALRAMGREMAARRGVRR